MSVQLSQVGWIPHPRLSQIIGNSYLQASPLGSPRAGSLGSFLAGTGDSLTQPPALQRVTGDFKQPVGSLEGPLCPSSEF